MNLVEHYITKIYSEKEITKNGKCFVESEVEVEVCCYGNFLTDTHFSTKEQWEKEKQQGYYFA